MKWKQYFSSEILRRGREYYEEGRVMPYNHKRDKYTFQVQGNKQYWVRIFYNHDQFLNGACTCAYAYAMPGEYCKHVAAAMYHIEQEEDNWLKVQQQRKEEERQAYLLKMEQMVLPEDLRKLCLEPQEYEADTDTYQYYDCKAMLKSFQWDENDVKEAWNLVENGSIRLDGIQTGFSSPYSYYGSDKEEGEMIGIANGYVDSQKVSCPVQIQFHKNSIYTATCQVHGCNNRYESYLGWGKRELCVHQKALFLLMYRELCNHDYGDATTEAAYTFMDQFRRKQVNRILSESKGMQSSELLSLYPKLQIRNQGWSVSFKIGNQKTYVVKNIPNLVKQIQNHETVTFGGKTQWNVSLEHLDTNGEKYYRYLRKNVEEEIERQSRAEFENPRYVKETLIRDSIPLFGHHLEDFRQLLGDQKMEVVDNREADKHSKMMGFREKVPKLQLTIRKMVDERRIFHGISIEGNVPVFMKGDPYLYYVGEDAIYYFDKTILDELEPFLATAHRGKISLKIGRNHLNSFYHNVLPWLKQYAEILEEDPESIEPYVSPEGVFTFYLDTEHGNLYCSGEVSYGADTLSMTSLLQRTEEPMDTRSFRDPAREEEVRFWLEKFFPQWDPVSQRAYCDEEERIYEILDEGVSKLLELGEVHASESFQRLTIQRHPRIRIGVSVRSSLMDLTIQSEDLSREELLDLLQSYKKKKKYHRLKNGSYVSLESESVEVLDQIMDTLHISPKEFKNGKMQIPTYRALYLDKMLEAFDSAYVDRDAHFKTLIKDFKTIEDADYEVPSSLRKVLRGYQSEGYRWLRTLDAYGLGGILADDMGLGKTLQMISLLLSRQGEGVSLIVAPASLVYNWKEEFQKYAPELKVSLVSGTRTERKDVLSQWKSKDVLITSYDLLKRDIMEYADMEFSYEIIDEAQYIKNHTTAAAKAVKVIKSRVRYALTGTPIENRLSELWSIFDYLMPGYLYAYDTFRKEMELPIVKNQEEDISLRLKKMVSPFILRRLKQQVLKDLPEKLEEIRYAKLETDQQRIYDAQVLHMKQILEGTEEAEFQKKKIQILAELTRIRQICCNPVLCLDGYTGTSAKTDACMDLISSAIEGEHKILLFSQFTSMLSILEERLIEKGIAYYKITGNTSKEERLRRVHAFNEDATPVFLISLKAGGTGLNLTGADVVIHYDPWWNTAVQNQATDRAHRIGQKKIVTVYKLIVKDSIEEKILQMQEAKKYLADAILSGENGTIGSMSKEDMLALLQ